MDIVFTPHGWGDFVYWLENDSTTAVRIKELLKAIQQDPFKGIGKPEALKHDLKGWWSRRITGEDRLVYRVTGTKGIDQRCIVIQCRMHYDDK
ncbi:MAG: Txe/YoeB family addiction module toxin [Flavobacterium sp.]|jgi:toxin YoeB|uniref:Txe/YoeB family addiction module toxin n=1 Tax=Flavobacterium sp. TaxID=239 RepID=UPI0022BBAFE8|nr:Txe/YoeB family addiction module toxin [Flavobacterium sp.]MCZ8298434.1 Txe/YoeB family addiction module toxin [Flavobacterium sp.]